MHMRSPLPEAVVAVYTLLLASAPAGAAQYKVTSTASAGVGSLRWAIKQANQHVGPDTVQIAPAIAGKVIRPVAALPEIKDAGTRLEGDLNGDGRPDIVVSGAKAGDASGLVIKANQCEITGFAVVKFARYGIAILDAHQCVIRSCHVGVNLAGSKLARNGLHQIYLYSADYNIIGGAGVRRNVIAAGSASPDRSGIMLAMSSFNKIYNNNLGVARDGKTALTKAGKSGIGVSIVTPIFMPRSTHTDRAALLQSAANRIGGQKKWTRNIFGGMRTGVAIRNSEHNSVYGNYFGLGRNGNTKVAISHECILINRGAGYNRIGASGWSSGGNVFAGGTVGIRIKGYDTGSNSIYYNYFGLNAAGDRQRPLATGILCENGPSRQSIVSNMFCAKSKYDTVGVAILNGGHDSQIEQNFFGLPPLGKNIPSLTPLGQGIIVQGVRAWISANRFGAVEQGIYFYDGWGRLKLNLFYNCQVAIDLFGDSHPNLGNLSNRSPSDDGDNSFYGSNKWYIRNNTRNYIRAEGNHFPGRKSALPHLKIWDHKDDPTLGRVDIVPRGDNLSSSSTAGILQVTNAAAVPTTGGGAEIVFTLSSPAEVTVSVFNIAGRPVATVARARPTGSGLQRLAWQGRADSGVPVPTGRYLVRIVARSPAGAEATALTAVTVGR